MFKRPTIWNQCAAFGAITAVFVTLATCRTAQVEQSLAGLTVAVGCMLLSGRDLRAR